jgi:hypothetical protein
MWRNEYLQGSSGPTIMPNEQRGTGRACRERLPARPQGTLLPRIVITLQVGRLNQNMNQKHGSGRRVAGKGTQAD